MATAIALAGVSGTIDLHGFPDVEAGAADVGELHFVRVRPLRDRDLSQELWLAGVGDLDDARPDAEVAHVPDVDDVGIPHDLHPVAAPIKVGVPDELQATLLQGAGRFGHGGRLWPV